MRTLVIGDIHGGYKALLQVLERAEVTATDTLIFLGDYVDGWSESAQVIDKIIALQNTNTCICIRGNHDVWCGSWLDTGATNPIWLAHGGIATTESYIQSGLITHKAHQTFFRELKDYHIDANNRLFLHAGYTSMHGVTKEVYTTNFYWDRTLWESALLAAQVIVNQGAIDKRYAPKRFKQYTEIYIGHTPTIDHQEDQPMKAFNLWNIDTGAAFTGKLSIMDIDTKQVWQSDPLPSLYPNEKGRN